MTKNEIIEVFKDADNYTWSIYFFSMNRRANNPYKTNKIRIKSEMLQHYMQNLFLCVTKYQLEKIETISDYTGENPKLSCDKLNLNSEIIKTNWNNFWTKIANSQDEKLKNKIKGYVLCGQPKEGNDHSLSIFKIANPVFDMNKDKRATVFKKVNEELDAFSDNLYRLYLSADFFIIDNDLYALNYKFEEIFDIDSTLQNLKTNSVNQILKIPCFSDDSFKNYAESYNHPKTFITLDNEKMEKIKDEQERIKISERFKIELDENNKFKNLSNDQSLHLLKYLCLKIIKDGDTNVLVEVAQATKLEIKNEDN